MPRISGRVRRLVPQRCSAGGLRPAGIVGEEGEEGCEEVERGERGVDGSERSVVGVALGLEDLGSLGQGAEQRVPGVGERLCVLGHEDVLEAHEQAGYGGDGLARAQPRQRGGPQRGRVVDLVEEVGGALGLGGQYVAATFEHRHRARGHEVEEPRGKAREVDVRYAVVFAAPPAFGRGEQPEAMRERAKGVADDADVVVVHAHDGQNTARGPIGTGTGRAKSDHDSCS